MRKKTPEGARESALASGWTIEGEPAADPETPDESAEQGPAGEPGDAALGGDAAGDAAEFEPDDGPAQLSNLMLVALGVLGGLYLLYAWVWLSWAQYYAEVNAQTSAAAGALGTALQQIVFWAAPLAPVLWFLAALLLNRERPGRMLLWILIGLAVLVPLPLFGELFVGGGS